MINFTDAFINPSNTTTAEEIPLAIEFAIDFETGEPIINPETNDLVVLTGKEALRVWIWKALKTEANKYRGYTYRYGQNLWKEIGTVYSRTVKAQMIYSEIEDTLMVNPRIKRVYNFNITVEDNGYRVYCSFSVDSVYGELTGSTIANLI